MKDLRNLTKAELIEVLVDNFNYQKSDLTKKVNIELKEMIAKESEFEKKQSGVSTFADDYIVQVMSGTDGQVSYDDSITHKSYLWTEHGDIQNMFYKELANIKRRHPRYLDEGWLLIMDEAIRKQLGQDTAIFIKPQEVERIFDLPTNEMLDEISKYQGAAYEVIFCAARKKCKGEINDLAKMKALIQKFGWHMEDFLES